MSNKTVFVDLPIKAGYAPSVIKIVRLNVDRIESYYHDNEGHEVVVTMASGEVWHIDLNFGQVNELIKQAQNKISRLDR